MWESRVFQRDFQDGMKRLALSVTLLRARLRREELPMNCMGVDVGKGYCQVCELSADGEMWEGRVRTDRERLEATFRTRPPARVLLESSTESEWVARVIEGVGHQVIVADPNYAPMYSHRTRRIKTDRRDARALAEACRLGAYRPAHRTADSRRHMRALIAVRENLVRTRTRWILLIRALLRREGLRTRSGHAESFVERVLELKMSSSLQRETEPLLDLLGPLNDQIDGIDNQLADLARHDEAARRLMTMPGVGPVVALAFVAIVDRVDRFRNGHQLQSYLGLVPREWSSSEVLRRGPITKTGNKRLRWLLVQTARAVMRAPSRRTTRPLWEWADRIGHRRSGRVAAVALARRVAGILYAMWRDNTDYAVEALIRRPRAQSA
jgi:transposase